MWTYGHISFLQFVRGADPILKLHDENNEVKEVLRYEQFVFATNNI